MVPADAAAASTIRLTEGQLSSSRLEAFSDGVIAIIMTIMVLDLQVPADRGPSGLMQEWPTFVSYVISYLLVARYWVNHHQMLHEVKTVNNRLLWSNILLLFCMSLVPFFTAFMASSRVNSFSVALYCVVMLLCGVAFLVLRAAINAQITDDAEEEARRCAAWRKNCISVALDCVAIPIAYVMPVVSLVLVFGIVASYFVPNAWVE